MKTLIYIMLSVFCLSCKGQNTQDSGKNKSTKEATLIDTISILPLKNKQYGSNNYKVLQLCNLDSEGYRNKSTSRIELTKNAKAVSSISLPIPDEEVKNFSVTKIAETTNGFEVAVNWGGGNNIYDVDFYFALRGSQFYLDEIKTGKYGADTEVTRTTKKINPPIPINKVKIIGYLE
ncbi:hypothetical protein [Flavobacterium sp. CS20]|uniref:hypothetical protein n=1 Tax=Flavobacterium sp. CS20 TaxID=2775246 RepID=UPI001B3A42C1|nr:hypothetical protein [Flavobacterium sp. CS20]QTY27580.1 hypothetical protein IGB25_03260 [Flavobacterium sp. CS20]